MTSLKLARGICRCVYNSDFGPALRGGTGLLHPSIISSSTLVCTTSSRCYVFTQSIQAERYRLGSLASPYHSRCWDAHLPLILSPSKLSPRLYDTQCLVQCTPKLESSSPLFIKFAHDGEQSAAQHRCSTQIFGWIPAITGAAGHTSMDIGQSSSRAGSANLETPSL